MIKKRLIIFASIILAVGLLAILIFRSFGIRVKPGQTLPTPIPTSQIYTFPTLDQTRDKLTIIFTDPPDKAIDVGLNKKIILTFNRTFNRDEVEFFIGPNVSFSESIEGQKLIITPQENYSPGVLYTYSVNYPQVLGVSRTYTFRVAGPTQEVPPDTAPSGFVEEQERSQREIRPDIYLSNKTPYTASDFSVTSEYSYEPFGHFAFKVTLTGVDKNQSKNSAIAWMKSLQLTDSQINSLDITYE